MGHGPAGHVYEALDLRTRTRVAIKVLEEQHGYSLPVVFQLWRQMHRFMSLAHLHIAPVHAYRAAPHGAYVVREFVDRQSLAAMLHEPLPFAQVKLLARQLASALAYAHGQGCAHGNLTPENVFFLSDSQIKLTDFATARAKDPISSQGGEGLDRQHDLRALGTLLYSALTGRRLTTEELEAGESIPPPSAIRPDAPPEWDEFVARLLSSEPGNRYSSAAEVERDVAALPTHPPAAHDGAEHEPAPESHSPGIETAAAGAPIVAEAATAVGGSRATTAPGSASSGKSSFLDRPDFPIWSSLRAVPIISLAAVAVAEFLTAYINPLAGVLLHLCLLVGFLTLGVVSPVRRQQAFFLAMSIAPLIRVVSLGMPLGQFPQAFWYVLTAVPLFGAAYLVTRMAELSRQDLSLRLPRLRHWPLQLLVAASGVGLGWCEWRILGAKAIVDGHSLLYAVGAAAILLICTGFLEEVLFRGIVQSVTTRLLGARGGLLLTAALFTALHIGWKSIGDLIFVCGVALYFGLVVRYTRTLLGVTLSHGAINTMLFIVLPLVLTPKLAPAVSAVGQSVPASHSPVKMAAPSIIRPRINTSSTKSRATFCWSAIPHAAGYFLKVMDQPRLAVHTTCASLSLKPGTYRWRVRAFTARGGAISLGTRSRTSSLLIPPAHRSSQPATPGNAAQR